MARKSILAAALSALTLTTPLAQESQGLRLSWSEPGADGLPAGWHILTFRHIPQHTRYSVVRDGGALVMKAESRASASALMHRISADSRQTPILRWRWKVENVLADSDLTRKQGDDHAARLYVAFAYDAQRVSLMQRIKYEVLRLLYGEYPPHAGLNYVWESKAPVGTMAPNPFTDRVRTVVVESGAARVGQWVEHERNVHEDYKRAFAEEPPMISGIAIMTDSDNTGESATAYYGEISLLPAAAQ